MAMYVDGEWLTGPNFISAFKPEASYGVAPFPPPADHPERANTSRCAGHGGSHSCWRKEQGSLRQTAGLDDVARHRG